MKYGLSEEIYIKIKNIEGKYSKYQFKIFGSRARGDYKKNSDIDIAVFGNIKDEDIQLGFKQGIIDDGEMWIQMMLSRNLLSHLCNEDTSREIFEKIRNEYIHLFVKLKDKFKSI